MRDRNLTAALSCLPERIRRVVAALPEELLSRTREIRLRAGRPLMLCGEYGVCFPEENGRYSHLLPTRTPVPDAAEIAFVVRALTEHSVYSHTDELNSGFVTYGDGMRAGVAGRAGTTDGKIRAVRDIRSVNLRLARNVDGAAQGLCDRLFAGGLKNTVLYGPPLSGKTTMLKDIARILSSEPRYYAVAVADERGELSAAQGVNIDFFTGYPKQSGVEYAMRSFAPDLILCDELGTDEECDGVLRAMGCGAKFVLSVHCGSRRELLRRPVCRRLAECGMFDYFVFLPCVGGAYEITEGEELLNEIRGVRHDRCVVDPYRDRAQLVSFPQSGGP